MCVCLRIRHVTVWYIRIGWPTLPSFLFRGMLLSTPLVLTIGELINSASWRLSSERNHGDLASPPVDIPCSLHNRQQQSTYTGAGIHGPVGVDPYGRQFKIPMFRYHIKSGPSPSASAMVFKERAPLRRDKVERSVRAEWDLAIQR